MRFKESTISTSLTIDMKLSLRTITHRDWFKVYTTFFDTPALVVGLELAVARIFDHLWITVVGCDAKRVHQILAIDIIWIEECVS